MPHNSLTPHFKVVYSRPVGGFPCFLVVQRVNWVGANVGEVGVEVNIVEAEEGISLAGHVDNSHNSVSVLVVVSPGDDPVRVLLAGDGVPALGWGAILANGAGCRRGAVVLVDLESVIARCDVGSLAGWCLLVLLVKLSSGIGMTYSCEDPRQSILRDQPVHG